MSGASLLPKSSELESFSDIFHGSDAVKIGVRIGDSLALLLFPSRLRFVSSHRRLDCAGGKTDVAGVDCFRCEQRDCVFDRHEDRAVGVRARQRFLPGNLRVQPARVARAGHGRVAKRFDVC